MNEEELHKALEDIVKTSDGSVKVIDYSFQALEMKIKLQQAQALENIGDELRILNSILRIK